MSTNMSTELSLVFVSNEALRAHGVRQRRVHDNQGRRASRPMPEKNLLRATSPALLKRSIGLGLRPASGAEKTRSLLSRVSNVREAKRGSREPDRKGRRQRRMAREHLFWPAAPLNHRPRLDRSLPGLNEFARRRASVRDFAVPISVFGVRLRARRSPSSSNSAAKMNRG
jgi:hypothetical protein